MHLCHLRKAAQRISRKAGLSQALNNKPGKHLGWNHPHMERVRNWVAFKVASGSYHERLICNFDQVWSLMWRPRRRTLQQSKASPDEFAKSAALKRIRRCVERVLDKDLTEDPEQKKGHSATPLVQGGICANVGIEQWRVPRTLTTLSWSDGTVSRAYISCRGDCLSESQRAQANQDRVQKINELLDF